MTINVSQTLNPGPINSYDSLQSAIINWLHRSDMVGIVPSLISMAEQRMDAELDSRNMDAVSSIVLTAGDNTASLPSDMMQMRRAMLMTDPVQVLSYMTPDQLSAQFPRSSSERPVAFTIIGSNIELAPYPDAAYTLKVVYQQRIPRLSSSNVSNWVLQYYPNVYLFGALVESAPYLKDDQRLPMWEQRYQQAVQNANSIDWYSGSLMRVKTL